MSSGLGSLVSLPFTLWDRWAKDRPEVWTVAESLLGPDMPGARHPFLVVRNPSKFPIRITAIRVQPSLFQVMEGQTVGAAAKVLNGKAASAFIEAGETKRFPIILPGEISEENRELPCNMVISWRSLRRETIPRTPVHFPTTIKNLTDRQNGQA